MNLLINLLGIRDPVTQAHSLMVLSLAEQVCRKLKINGDDLFHIKLAALLHDIGKIGIPEEILSKTESLSPDEYVRMHQHVHYGYNALSGIKRLSTARELMFHHHENYDGTGYPRGLKGEEIPMGQDRCVGDASRETRIALTKNLELRKHALLSEAKTPV